jgi:hypothetical protein
MKRLLRFLPFCVFLWAACSNEFDVAAPWKEIPVVYALLSPKDTANYIRVEKAFLDPDGDARKTAKIADSLYYPAAAITVTIKRVGGTEPAIVLTRVDGVKEGIVRAEGIFATEPNVLYKIKPSQMSLIRPGERYQLIVQRKDGKPNITAETVIPKDFRSSNPNSLQIPPLLSFTDKDGTTLDWRTDENGVFFNVALNIRYREEDANGGLIARKVLSWTPLRNVRRGNDPISGGNFSAKGTIQRSAFYDILSKVKYPNAAEESKVFVRYFEPWDLTITGGGKEIAAYLQTAEAAAGLIGAEVLPTYTNLSEGFGLFTSKNSVVLPNIKLTNQSVDSIRANKATFDLKFSN